MPERHDNKKKSAVTCKEVTEVIMDYLNGELNDDDVRLFESHLDGCPDCVAFLNTYKKTVELTRAFLKKK